ncbi:MAG: hypothetical protein LBV40_05775 [Methanomicrobiales archaeon]|jgi:DNA replication factor GINS|nr:hypothetical protein [Methanomicrobiales archaeon]
MSLEELRGVLLTERESGKVTSLRPHLFEQTHAEIMQLQAQVYATEDPFSSESQMLIEKIASIRVTIEEIFSIRSSKIVSLALSHADGSFIDREELKLLHSDELSMFQQVVEAIRACRSVLIDQKAMQQSSVPLSVKSPSLHSQSKSTSPLSPLSVSSDAKRALPSLSLSSSPERDTSDHFNISETLHVDNVRDEMDLTSLDVDNAVQDQDLSSPPVLSNHLKTEEGDPVVAEQGLTDSISDSKAYSLVLIVADMDPFMGIDGFVYEIQNGDVITLPRKNADILAERNIALNIRSI